MTVNKLHLRRCLIIYSSDVVQIYDVIRYDKYLHLKTDRQTVSLICSHWRWNM